MQIVLVRKQDPTTTKGMKMVNLEEKLGVPTEAYFWQTVARYQFFTLPAEKRQEIARIARAHNLNEYLTFEECAEEGTDSVIHTLKLYLGITAISNKIYGMAEAIENHEKREEFFRNQGTVTRGVFNFLRWVAIDY